MKVRELFEVEEKKPKLIELLRLHCPRNLEAIAKGEAPLIFRGTEQKSNKYQDIKYGDIKWLYSSVRTKPRKSLTGFNLFLSYVSQAPDWKRAPNRAYSSSCTDDLKMSMKFEGSGDSYVVIPVDTVNNFAVTREDFNLMTPTGSSRNLMAIANIIEAIRSAPEYVSTRDVNIDPALKQLLSNKILERDSEKAFSMKNIEELSKAIAEICEYMGTSDKKRDVNGVLRLRDDCEYLETALGTTNILEWMKKKITIEDLGVKIFSDFKDVKMKGTAPEIWFVGDWIGIKCGSSESDEYYIRKILEDILKRVKG